MPGSIFQDNVTDPTGRYAEVPSAAGNPDTSMGDFLTAVAPAAREVQSGYRLAKQEAALAPLDAEGASIVQEAASGSAELALNQTFRLEAIDKQDKEALLKYDLEIKRLEGAQSSLGPRAVEVQARKDSLTRDFIIQNPHLASDAKARANAPLLAAMAKGEETLREDYAKKIQGMKLEYGVPNYPGSDTAVLDINRRKMQQKDLEEQRKHVVFNQEQNKRNASATMENNASLQIDEITNAMKVAEIATGGNLANVDAATKAKLTQQIKGKMLAASNLVRGKLGEDASIDPAELDRNTLRLTNTLKIALGAVDGTDTLKEAQDKIKTADAMDVLHVIDSPLGDQMRAMRYMKENFPPAHTYQEQALQRQQMKQLEESFKNSRNSPGSMPTITSLGGNKPGLSPEAKTEAVRLADKTQTSFLQAAPVVVGRSSPVESKQSMDTMILSPLAALVKDPTELSPSASFVALSNVGSPPVLERIKLFSPVEREKYSTTISKAQELYVKNSFLPEIERDLGATIKGVGVSVANALDYSVDPQGGLKFSIKEKTLSVEGGLDPTSAEALSKTVDYMNKIYGPGSQGRVFNGLSKFHNIVRALDGIDNGMSSPEGATQILLRDFLAGAKKEPSSPIERKAEAPIIGSLSAKFESNGSPASVGFDERGGKSYGVYQLATNMGMPQKFVSTLDNPNWKTRLQQAGDPSLPAFQKMWETISKEDKVGFSAAQDKFAQSHLYEPVVKALANNIGMDVEKRSEALKKVVWSTAIQHGQEAANIIMKAYYTVKKPEDDRELISKIYEIRKTRFGGSTPTVKAGVMQRFEKEQALALGELG